MMFLSLADLYILNLACGLYLTGLVWTIQLAHYPSFYSLSKESFQGFMQFHQRAMTILVAPIMISELALSGLLFLQNPDSLFWISIFVIALLLWLFTFLVSVPLHTKLLAEGYNEEIIARLIKTNWPRTVLWSCKSIMMILFFKTFINL